MKYKAFILYILFSISSIEVAFSQKKNVANLQAKPVLERTSCDCKTAIAIDIFKSQKYGPTTAPVGYGEQMEIKAKQKGDNTSFEEEHNTAWYLLNIEHTGELAIDIAPIDSLNDYDFLLYKVPDSILFCSDLLNKKIQPIRSNLSKNKEKTSGITGLSSSAKSPFKGKGPGDNFSSSVQVNKGEKYMLVLDNLSPNGKGHAIYFSYMVKIHVAGVVVDFLKHPLSVEVTLLDEKNKKIAATISNAQTGKYDITALVKENSFSSTVYYAPAFIPESAFISTRLLKTNENVITINKTMSGLKVGETYPLAYYKSQEQAFDLREEWSPFYALSILLEKNPTMKVRLEVHADEESDIKPWNRKALEGTKKTIQEWRTMNLKALLNEKLIKTDRIEIVASDKMVVPNPKTEEERKQNRQVSLIVLSK